MNTRPYEEVLTDFLSMRILFVWQNKLFDRTNTGQSR